MTAQIIVADVRDGLAALPGQSIQCVVTSPPYWNQRDYGVAGQMGLEATAEDYIAGQVAVFREVRRVLRRGGTLWLNLGDSFAADKNLHGMPWRVALALQADGWYLRSDIIYSKPNPMPESVTDRPTRAHEYVFLLTKQPRYYYDADAIREEPKHTGPVKIPSGRDAGEGAHGCSHRDGCADKQRGHSRRHEGFNDRWNAMSRAEQQARGANKRSVWTIATQPFHDAHFATFPEALVEPCILAGSREGDTVLDPFAGSGTVGVVALRHNRRFVGIELNHEYAEMARRRITGDAPLLNKTTLIGGAA